MTSAHIPNAKYNKVKSSRKMRTLDCANAIVGVRENESDRERLRGGQREGGKEGEMIPATGTYLLLPYCSHWMFTSVFLMVASFPTPTSALHIHNGPQETIAA